MGGSRLMFWFIIYELVCISVSIIVGLELILIHSATRVESIVFIRSRSVLEALIHIWSLILDLHY